jgi:TPM domain
MRVLLSVATSLILMAACEAFPACHSYVVAPTTSTGNSAQTASSATTRLFSGDPPNDDVSGGSRYIQQHHRFSSSAAAGEEKTRRDLFSNALQAVGAAAVATTGGWMAPPIAHARLESVNRPDLLPSEKGLNVIQTEPFLTPGQAKRMDKLLGALERDTGFRVRVLCQSYPNTPGLAIRDYWSVGSESQKDDKYVVLVIDQFGGRGNILNVNVGDGVKFALPNIFWTRLQAKYGTTFYVRDNGIDLAVQNAVEAIATCLRSEDKYCVQVPDAAPSLKSLGMM